MTWTRGLVLGLLAVALLSASAFGVERFPPPQFETEHDLPTFDRVEPPARAGWLTALDVVVFVAALALATWLVHWRRSRRGIVILSAFCLAYFGFFRGGCVCPVGSIQNVSLALADAEFHLHVSTLLYFALPVLVALLFGRVFCGAVCPLGALQDLVLFRPVRVPSWLGRALGIVPFFYLGFAVLMASMGSAFVVCVLDPFVGFFRLSGPLYIILLGLGFLALGVFVGRPYCRFLCPYGALLNLCSRVASKRVSTTPDECIVCGLCRDACPFDAIEPADPDAEAEA